MLESFLSQMQEHIRSAPLLALVASYAAGVLVSFTPCVYPVIPITVAYIGGRSRGHGKRRHAFWLTFVYVMGMAIVYSGLGLLASLTGKIFGTVASHPASLFVVANLCIFFGLSMFGVVSLPTFGLKRVDTSKRGGLLGALLIGMGSGLIVGPCTAPVLGAILVYVAREGSAAYGALLLFVFALGIGTLFLFIGTFVGLAAGLPKSGAWLQWVNRICGWFLILVGEYFLIQMGQRIL